MAGTRSAGALGEWAVTLAGLLLSVVANDVLAQSAETAAAPPQLEPIVVTAQRKAEDAQDVPISLSVIDGQRLRDGLIRNAEDMAEYTANLHLSLSYGVEASIRGIGSHDIPTAESSVGIFRDGVYLGHGTFNMGPLLDLERVEVVRGAQGTLLGKNTPAGALLFTTRDPADRAEFSGRVTTGNLQRQAIEAAGSLPLGDDFGLRLAAAGDRSEGFMSDVTRNERQLAPTIAGGRAKLHWHPSGPWSGWLSLEKGKRNVYGDSNQVSHATDQMQSFATQYDPRFEDRIDLQNELNASDTGVKGNSEVGTAHLAYQSALGELVSITNVARANGWFALDGDVTPATVANVSRVENYRQVSQELRLQGSVGTVDYIGGAYYLRNRSSSQVDFELFPDGTSGLSPLPSNSPAELATLVAAGSGSAVANFRQQSRAISPYTQLAWHVSEVLTATAGLRYTREDKGAHMSNTLTRGGNAFIVLLNEEDFPDMAFDRRETDFSPRVFVQYKLNDDVNLYGGWLRGFKGGGFDDLAGQRKNVVFDGERSSGYEAGVKAQFPVHGLDVNLNLFDTDYRNLQVYDFEGDLLKVDNAPRTRIRGAELDGRWLLGSGFGTNLSLGYLNTRYIEFPDAPGPIHENDPPNMQHIQDLSGHPLQRAPTWSGALGVQYQSPLLWRDIGARAGVDAIYRSSEFLNANEDPLGARPSSLRLNALLRVGPAGDAWSLDVFGRNLTNRILPYRSADVPIFEGAHACRIDPPRAFGATLAFAL